MRCYETGSAHRPKDVLDGLSRTRVWAVLTRLAHGDRSIPPPLEPMLPALAETVLFWSGGGKRQVLVTHDEQSALTAGRLSRLQQVLAVGVGASPPDDADQTGSSAAGISPLAGLVMVDSRDDPRVQVADLLAGVPRRLPGDRRRPPTPAVPLPNLTTRSPAGSGPEIAGKGPAFGGHLASGLPALSAVARRGDATEPEHMRAAAQAPDDGHSRSHQEEQSGQLA